MCVCVCVGACLIHEVCQQPSGLRVGMCVRVRCHFGGFTEQPPPLPPPFLEFPSEVPLHVPNTSTMRIRTFHKGSQHVAPHEGHVSSHPLPTRATTATLIRHFTPKVGRMVSIFVSTW